MLPAAMIRKLVKRDEECFCIERDGKMTEKYFRYLMKQSLPLFLMISGFELLFAFDFINIESLPMVLTAISLIIPFVFQFWQFRRKAAYTYGAPIRRESVILVRFGVILFLVLVPACLLLFVAASGKTFRLPP